MNWVILFVIWILVHFLPLGISFLNKNSTHGLRVLCGGFCFINAVLGGLLVYSNQVPSISMMSYGVFILLSMDVALRKTTKDIDVQ